MSMTKLQILKFMDLWKTQKSFFFQIKRIHYLYIKVCNRAKTIFWQT